jgi:hypothetical protein
MRATPPLSPRAASLRSVLQLVPPGRWVSEDDLAAVLGCSLDELHVAMGELRRAEQAQRQATLARAEPATLAQVAEVRRLAAARPSWPEHLNGAAWERCFDLCEDGSKFVSRQEAAEVQAELLALEAER